MHIMGMQAGWLIHGYMCSARFLELIDDVTGSFGSIAGYIIIIIYVYL